MITAPTLHWMIWNCREGLCSLSMIQLFFCQAQIAVL